jgi:hypothetical protein
VIFDLTWNSVCNLGIKCNAAPLARKAGVRYWSSPFDNIDTVDGLTEVADILSSKYANYFESIGDWDIKNDFSSTGEFRTKIFWHKKYPKVYYPHFNERWLSHDLTSDGLKEWFTPDILDLNPIWLDFTDTFGRRASRLISQLEVTNTNLLFLRIEEPVSIKRIMKTDVQREAEYFIEKVSQTFPDSTIGLLYIYADSDENKRSFVNTDKIDFVGVSPSNYENESIEVIKRLKLLTE